MSPAAQLALYFLFGAIASFVARLRPARKFKGNRMSFVALGAVGQIFSIVVLGSTSWIYVVLSSELRDTVIVPYGLVIAGPMVVLLPCYLLLKEFVVYWSHRALHSRWLWPTHRWHHHVEHLNWWSGAFGSPVHLLMTGSPAIFTLALFDLNTVQALVFTVWTLGLNVFIHSNVAVPRHRLARTLGWLFVLPNTHRLHHGAEARFRNCNFCFVLTVWDRLFGTYVDPFEVDDSYPLGLGEETPSQWRMALGIPGLPHRS